MHSYVDKVGIQTWFKFENIILNAVEAFNRENPISLKRMDVDSEIPCIALQYENRYMYFFLIEDYEAQYRYKVEDIPNLRRAVSLNGTFLKMCTKDYFLRQLNEYFLKPVVVNKVEQNVQIRLF